MRSFIVTAVDLLEGGLAVDRTGATGGVRRRAQPSAGWGCLWHERL